MTAIRTTLIAALATLALAGCDYRTEDGRTVGQKLDNAIDRTQQKLTEAGQKIQPKVEEAAQKTEQKLHEAGEKTQQALSGAGEKIKETTISVTPGAQTADNTPRAMSDAAITASIKTDYLKDPDLSVFKIDVDTKNGVVTLNGLANDEQSKQRAEKLAGAVKGVREVRNFLVIKRA